LISFFLKDGMRIRLEVDLISVWATVPLNDLTQFDLIGPKLQAVPEGLGK
jgi:hypothetical protein